MLNKNALPRARSKIHQAISESGVRSNSPPGDRLDRLQAGFSSSGPALTPHLPSRSRARPLGLIRNWRSSIPISDLELRRSLNTKIPRFLFCHGISHNGPQVGDVALSPTRAKGHVAERRVAAPRSPSRLLRRRCAYALLCEGHVGRGQTFLLALR
jgi:hypothetical protein